jgi:pyridoxal/pyridoxine/pyridoxamine kinase
MQLSEQLTNNLKEFAQQIIPGLDGLFAGFYQTYKELTSILKIVHKIKRKECY